MTGLRLTQFDFGFGIWDLGFGILDFGFRIWDIWDFGFWIWDLGYLGFGIWDLGFGISRIPRVPDWESRIALQSRRVGTICGSGWLVAALPDRSIDANRSSTIRYRGCVKTFGSLSS
ncbi:MAG: hypothetical protein IPJ30_05405 [Acidobacteria bacterium]|nr:hypothetical protein [Acidobacteriota bacterium]